MIVFFSQVDVRMLHVTEWKAFKEDKLALEAKIKTDVSRRLRLECIIHHAIEMNFA